MERCLSQSYHLTILKGWQFSKILRGNLFGRALTQQRIWSNFVWSLSQITLGKKFKQVGICLPRSQPVLSMDCLEFWCVWNWDILSRVIYWCLTIRILCWIQSNKLFDRNKSSINKTCHIVNKIYAQTYKRLWGLFNLRFTETFLKHLKHSRGMFKSVLNNNKTQQVYLSNDA